MSKRTFKGVVVEWVDAASSADWTSYESAMKEKVANVTSVGYLLSGGKKGQDLKIVSSIGDDGELMGILTIPAQWILKITQLGITATMKEPDDA